MTGVALNIGSLNRVGRTHSLSRRLAPCIFDNAAVAYSLRIPAGSMYSGPLIRVRRSSDNAEQDIYASSARDSNGDLWLDTTALLAFAGVGSAYVRTWYSQVGSLHATQTTAANQPRIVNAGVVDTSNSKPTVVWDSTGTLELKATIPFTTYPSAINVVASILSSSASKGVFAMIGDDNGPAIGAGNTSDAANFGTNVVGLKGLVAWMPTNGTLTVGTSKILTLKVPQGSSASTIFGDGSTLTINGGATSTPNTPSGSFWIGGHPSASIKLRQASISEVLCFSGAFVQQRLIEKNQGNAFGISVA